MKTKKTISTRELKQKHSKWMKNFVYGVQEIIYSHPDIQHWIFYILLQDCLYNKTTNPFFAQMYQRDEDFYKKETDDGLEDYQLAPLDRKRLFDGMEELITSGSRKKFMGVLGQLGQSYEKGEY